MSGELAARLVVSVSLNCPHALVFSLIPGRYLWRVRQSKDLWVSPCPGVGSGEAISSQRRWEKITTMQPWKAHLLKWRVLDVYLVRRASLVHKHVAIERCREPYQCVFPVKVDEGQRSDGLPQICLRRDEYVSALDVVLAEVSAVEDVATRVTLCRERENRARLARNVIKPVVAVGILFHHLYVMTTQSVTSPLSLRRRKHSYRRQKRA